MCLFNRYSRVSQATVRATLLGLMGVPKSNKLPKRLNSGFWTGDIEDVEARKTALLRPRWGHHVRDNEEWILQVASIVKNDGKTYYPNISQAYLDGSTLKDTSQAIRTTFTSWAKAWKVKKQSADEQAAQRRTQRRKKRARDVSAKNNN